MKKTFFKSRKHRQFSLQQNKIEIKKVSLVEHSPEYSDTPPEDTAEPFATQNHSSNKNSFNKKSYLNNKLKQQLRNRQSSKTSIFDSRVKKLDQSERNSK